MVFFPFYEIMVFSPFVCVKVQTRSLFKKYNLNHKSKTEATFEKSQYVPDVEPQTSTMGFDDSPLDTD